VNHKTIIKNQELGPGAGLLESGGTEAALASPAKTLRREQSHHEAAARAVLRVVKWAFV
jgi:hypothetical protein